MSSVASKNNTSGHKSLRIDFTDESISANAGLVFVARTAQQLGLVQALGGIELKKRKRGISDADANLSLIYNLCAGNGRLADLDMLAHDGVTSGASGLQEVLNSRRASEHLLRFTPEKVEQLQGVARNINQSVVRTRALALQAQLGYVPVFIDGGGIEVEGKLFEGARIGYNGQLQYWLHAIFVGDVWASNRLHPGGGDVASSWREQLERDVAPNMPSGVRPWARMDNAYYRGECVHWMQEHGWDYSISVTNDNNTAPILRQLRGDSGHVWRRINDDEQATIVWHKPAGWARPQAYVVVCTQYENKQALLDERYSVIAVSRTDLNVKELVHRHRAKQGQENALKGPLIELDLHHPPCRSLTANQAFYTLGQLAHTLLMTIKYHSLPEQAHQVGLGRIVRWVVRAAGKFVRTGRRLKLLLSKSNWRLDWLAHCAGQLGFG